jgi:glycosyltransferase involved in cell wall biosynthesis
VDSKSTRRDTGQPVLDARHRALSVATVPEGHVYVRHLAPVFAEPDLVEVRRLADPDPDEPGRSAVSKWWPPVMLDPDWIRAHDEFDLMHIQFGFDALDPRRLRAVVDALRETGRPLVYTAHDLRNPHHESRELHDEQLDVLVPAADAVVTLTRGAAAEISRRWNRTALVLPHPHVVPFATMGRIARQRTVSRAAGVFRVGVHVKSLRASMDPLPVIRALERALRDLPRTVLQVNGHRDVLLRGGARYAPALAEYLEDAAAAGRIDLRVHDFLEDDELFTYLEELDVSVLPYRFGTHSGWLEACRDVGTAVIAPDCGYYRHQGDVFEYHHDESGLDEPSLARAVSAAYAAGSVRPLSVAYRRDQRQAVARAHAELYRSLVA